MRAYRLLCGAMAALLAVIGVALIGTFFAFHMPDANPALPTGPMGHYFAAFTGCGLLAWSGALVGAARRPDTGRTVGTATATALVLGAIVRMSAWVTGDYYVWPGEILRVEAALFLLLALGFVWLRPPPLAPAAP
jgi:hypothetical protein